MSRHLPRGTVKEARRLATLCEIHAGHAHAELEGQRRTGPWLIHDSLAREYSAKAFALAKNVQVCQQHAGGAA